MVSALSHRHMIVLSNLDVAICFFMGLTVYEESHYQEIASFIPAVDTRWIKLYC